MEADKRPSETENARQLRDALQQIRTDRSRPPVPISPPVASEPIPAPAPTQPSEAPQAQPTPAAPPAPARESERIKTFSAPTHRSPPPLQPKKPASPAKDTLLPLAKPEATPEEDPVERLRRLIEERRKQTGDSGSKRPSGPPPRPPAAPQTPAPATPSVPSDAPKPPIVDEDPAARLRRLVDERRQKLAAERGDPPPPPLEPRAPFKPKPPQADAASSAPASPPPQSPPQPQPPSAEDSPAERLRRMLEEHRRTMESNGDGNAAEAKTDVGSGTGDADESPAERLAKMLEQRRRSNQTPSAAPAAAPAERGGASPSPMGNQTRGFTPAPPRQAGMPQPRDHLPPPEARKQQKPPQPPRTDLPTFWKRIQETSFGRALHRLGMFYLKVAGVALWTAVFLFVSWGVCLLVLDGFSLFSTGDWERLQIRYRAGLTIPWNYVLTLGCLAAVWIAGAVLVWRKGKPYVWPVLVVLAQLALLPVALALASVAGILMGVIWIARRVRQLRAKSI